MSSSTVPLICGVALAAMSAAGVTHWMSVRDFVAAMESGASSVVRSPQPAPEVPDAGDSLTPPVEMPAVQAPLAMGDLSDQQEFFRDLVAEIRSLRQENHDLKDQIGETNRDLMKLEFRVDTHSESFRPLNLTAEPEDTTYDDGPGVLPPRAEPVGSFNE
jgi:hypothetical protein